MDTIPSPTATAVSPLARQTFLECEAMARFALSSGLKVPGGLLQRLRALEAAVEQGTDDPQGGVVRRLGDCHSQLAQLIAPATPRTILLLDSEARQGGFLRFLGPLPLTRQMMITALLSLAALICLTLSPDVNGSKNNTDILLGSGMPLLLNELFLLAAAALGASFSALFIANRYLQEGTFDPRYNISYWVRFVLGLIAGFILGTLIDINSLHTAAGSAADAASPFARPLLAMLGGFSASVVYRILNRLAESVESLFRGDLRDQVKTQTDAERSKLKADAEQERNRLASRLMDLQRKIAGGETSAALQAELDTLMRELLGEDAPETEAAQPAPAQ